MGGKIPGKDWLGSTSYYEELNMSQQREVWFKKHSGRQNLKKKKFVSLFWEREREREREKQRVQAGEGQKERERENLKQAPRSAWNLLRARSHDLKITTWADIKSLTLNQLGHPGAPGENLLNAHFIFKHLMWSCACCKYCWFGLICCFWSDLTRLYS